ncbi:MAG: prepilin-type N-terminal cleavage/methylation domain-containing protein [Planctomycetota bacterium]|jgi:prepilin-type N-terminal cleavage/methylation domain-containing protein|nr:prepilin-type N-terminal cleavage/methylation domain-containing protein [Planctomycetota bacterium]
MSCRAFTLIELLLATALGAVVLLGLYSAFGTATTTIQVVGQLERENELMRLGFAAALEEADFWLAYDDPRGGSDPLHTALRTVYPPTEMGYHNDVRFGLPFVPLSLYTPGQAGAGAGFNDSGDAYAAWNIRPSEPLLEPAGDNTLTGAAARGLANRERINQLDRDRGLDDRPYQANDPRRWYRGNVFERAFSWHPYGRYALVSNRSKQLDLGTGSDWLDISYDASVGPMRSGPYGQVANATPNAIQTATWLPNQLLFLHDALGYYGMHDYLPANTLSQVYGNGPSGLLPRLDGQVHTAFDQDLDGSSNTYDTRTSIRSDAQVKYRDDHRAFLAPSRQAQSYEGFISLVPAARYNSNAFHRFGAGGRTSNLLTESDKTTESYLGDIILATTQRCRDGSPMGHADKNESPIIRSTAILPIGQHLPSGWPDLQLDVMRTLIDGHFIHNMRILWTDRESGERSELSFNIFATTLRGARRQRHPNGGWARFAAADPSSLGLSVAEQQALNAAQRHLDSPP